MSLSCTMYNKYFTDSIRFTEFFTSNVSAMIFIISKTVTSWRRIGWNTVSPFCKSEKICRLLRVNPDLRTLSCRSGSRCKNLHHFLSDFFYEKNINPSDSHPKHGLAKVRLSPFISQYKQVRNCILIKYKKYGKSRVRSEIRIKIHLKILDPDYSFENAGPGSAKNE